VCILVANKGEGSRREVGLADGNSHQRWTDTRGFVPCCSTSYMCVAQGNSRHLGNGLLVQGCEDGQRQQRTAMGGIHCLGEENTRFRMLSQEYIENTLLDFRKFLPSVKSSKQKALA